MTSIGYATVAFASHSVGADWLMNTVSASCPPGGGAPTLSVVQKSIGWLWLDSVFIVGPGGVFPGTDSGTSDSLVYPIPDGGEIRINEVVVSAAAITVNAVHILAPGGIDFVLSSSTASANCGSPGGIGCVRTMGYWKTHYPSAWPASVLSGGMNLGTVHYTAAQLESIFNTQPRGNGLIILAHQLIAANLNIAAGAGAPASVTAAIAQANALIGNLIVPPAGSGFLSPSLTGGLTTTLDQFNSGLTPDGPAHCD